MIAPPSRIALFAAWMLLANGLLGLAPSLWSWFAGGKAGAVPYLSLLGIVCACLSLRGQRAGWWGGIVFYAVQVCSFYPYSGAWHVSMKAGLSLAWVHHVAEGVLVVNLAAAVLCGVSAMVLLRRKSGPLAPVLSEK